MIADFGNAAAPRAPNYDHVKSKFRVHLLSKGFGRKAAGRLVSFVRFPSHAAAHPFDLLLVRVNGRMRGYMNGGRLPHQLLITPLNIRFTSMRTDSVFFQRRSHACNPDHQQSPQQLPAPPHILDTLSHLKGHFCPILSIHFRTEVRFYFSLGTVGVCCFLPGSPALLSTSPTECLRTTTL